jgi:hypothetical protein
MTNQPNHIPASKEEQPLIEVDSQEQGAGHRHSPFNKSLTEHLAANQVGKRTRQEIDADLDTDRNS